MVFPVPVALTPPTRASEHVTVPCASVVRSFTGRSIHGYLFLKGAAPLWNEMGNGNWATDPYYAGKVLSTYAKMLAFAAARGPVIGAGQALGSGTPGGGEPSYSMSSMR